MGQRCNYIIKQNDVQTIYYSHWGANNIVKDIALGENRFITYVKECKIVDDFLDAIWMEGCVAIDIDSKKLAFWSWEFICGSSVIDYYLSEVKKKWKNWEIIHATNQMYDIEKVIDIDYISKQEILDFANTTSEEIEQDDTTDYETTIVVIKESNSLSVIKTADINLEKIVSYGEGIIGYLLQKTKLKLPIEGKVPVECIVIDVTKKEIFIDTFIFGIWESNHTKWKDYNFKMGDYRYLETLKMAGIDTTMLVMSKDEVIREYNDLIREDNGSFDPFEFAKQMTEETNNVQFNPDFFETTRPSKTLVEKIKIRLNKLFK